MSKDGRHIIFVSKDFDLIKTFMVCLGIKNKIGTKKSGYNKNGKYYYVQFGNVRLYRWLNSIGIWSNKSKFISDLKILDKYFFDFLRGLIDGDGCISSFIHPESRHPQIRVRICSASKPFLLWLKDNINRLLYLEGKIRNIKTVFELVYYKHSSIVLLKRIYKKVPFCLNRKFEIAKVLLADIAELA